MCLRKHSFDPVVSPGIRVLVLGSLPGERSLSAGRYYAHPQNRFWHLIGCAIGSDIASLGYEARLAALLAKGIGLWDTVRSAQRDGSLDAALRQVQASDVAALVANLPQLRAIAFNGKASERIGRPLLAQANATLVALPSSSPANASIPLTEKERCWKGLREYLD